MSLDIFNSSKEFEFLRQDIHFLMRSPIDRTEIFISEIKHTVETDYPDKIRIFQQPDLPRIKKFFAIIRDETRKASKDGIKMDRFMRGLIIRSRQQDNLDHEFAHIKKAQELGINIGKCKLWYGFITDESDGLGLYIAFATPRGTDLFSDMLITLAPDELSNGDFQFILSNARKLTFSEREVIHNMYSAKIGTDVRLFGE